MIAFGVIYCLITPKNELKMIREGNLSVSISLVGSLIGFTVMMAAVMMNASLLGVILKTSNRSYTGGALVCVVVCLGLQDHRPRRENGEQSKAENASR